MRTSKFVLFLITFSMPLYSAEVDEKIILSGVNSESGNSTDGKWSYSFLLSSPNSKSKLSNQRQGKVFFEDDDWIITCSEIDAFNSNRKSDIIFYNAKTLENIAIARVPNCIQQIGRIKGTNFFFAVTKKYLKYNFDDGALVLMLIDPFNKNLERNILTYSWMLANSQIKVCSEFKNLAVGLDREEFAEFNKKPFLQGNFKEIGIKYFPSKNSPDDDSLITNKYIGDSLTKKSLYYLSSFPKYLNKENSESEDKIQHAFTLNIQKKGKKDGIHFIRPFNGGEIQDINLSKIGERSFKVSNSIITNVGIFESGTLYCFSDNSVVFLDETQTRFSSDKSTEITFDLNAAYIIAQNDPTSESQDQQEKWQRISQDGEVSKCYLPESFKNIILSDNDFVVRPEKNSVVVNSRSTVLAAGDGQPNVFSVYSIQTGTLLLDPIKSETGVYGYSEDTIFNNVDQKWRIGSIITGFFNSNGNKLFSIFIHNSETKKTFILADNLSVLPDLIECEEAKDSNVDILYSSSNQIKYLRFNPATEKTTTIQEWISTSNAGAPLFEKDNNFLFIPKSFGYEVHRVFDKTTSEHIFDFHLGSSGSYAVVLPNGVYAGSPGCEDLINLPAGEGMVDSSAVLPWRNRPAEVLKAIGGDPEQIEVLSKVTERWLRKLGNPEKNPEPTAADIPILTLANDVPLWAKSDEVLLKFEAKPGTAPVKDVIVRVNGVDQQRGENSVANQSSIERTIKLAEGQNWIEAVAIDEKGRSSNLARFRTILSEASKPAKRYIVAVGVSKYKNSDLNLEFAAKDATDLAAAIKGSTKGETEVLLLTNDQATKDAPAKIREFLATATENDEVVAFCAGHGVLDSNLDYVYASHEFDSANPSETGIKLDELVDAIGTSRSLKRLLLLDTCHSGQVGEKDEMLLAKMDTELPKGVRAVKQRGMSVKPTAGLSAEGQQRFIEEMFLLPGLHRGINIIGASGGAEFALESAQWNNGVFTAAIIESLREKKADWNEDGRVSVGELRNYLAQRVSELTKGAQKPSVVAAERDQEFDLIRASYKRQSAPSIPEPSSIQISSELPPENTLDLESRIRSYYQATQGRNEAAVGTYFADQVDYYSSGTIPKSKVMADVRGDWKRYSNSTFTVSNFESLSPTSCQFILDYSLMQGDRPRRGKLQMNATLTSDQPQRIQSIKAKVISAK